MYKPTAWDEGCVAWDKGLDDCACPYAKDTYAWQDWMRGYVYSANSDFTDN